MIIALLALAFAMIVGGLLAAFFGWDIVLIERGWTMVIAGSFSAACGALLLGITAVVSKLARIQSELTRLQIGFDEAARDEASPSSTDLSVAALAGGMLGGTMLAGGEAREPDKTQPDKTLFPEGNKSEAEGREGAEASSEGEPMPPLPPKALSDEVSRPDEEEVDVKVPDFLLAERREETYGEARTEPAEISLFTDEPRLDEPEKEQPDELVVGEPGEPLTEPASADGLEAEPEPARLPEEASDSETGKQEAAGDAPRSPATVVGTYNSGDNTYVMYSDGSIEAQTPRGVFHFQSLDELKAFIASGGESGNAAI